MSTPSQVIELIKQLLDDNSIVFQHQLQELWSGYGAIVRCLSVKHNKTYIVKVVSENTDGTPHPRGWNTSASHQRKLVSYQIEAHFYQHYSHLTDIDCYTPKLLAIKKLIANEKPHKSDNLPAGQLLVMEDLDALNYNHRVTTATWQHVQQGIKWLAYFHAKFMRTNEDSAQFLTLSSSSSSSNECSETDGLWPIGSYWHLATRQDELAGMSHSCVMSCELKQAAARIDAQLNSACFQTIIHGDAKLENMCFNLKQQRVAAVDFQYVGHGVGVKDLAYFIGSAFNNDDLVAYEDKVLELYFEQLNRALKKYNKHTLINTEQLEAEYRLLYPLAWADFHRFLLGWNPKSWKVNDYMNHMSQKALSNL